MKIFGTKVILEPKIFKNFITENERLELLAHANSMKLFVNRVKAPYGTRNARRIDGSHLANELVQTIFNRIANTLELKDPVIDPNLGQIVSVIKPGGFVHLHRDIYKKPEHLGKTNLRFNIMVDRGEDISYNPIIEDRTDEVNRCDAWCFAATKYMHKTEVIKGPENRVVYQFGFMI